MLVYSLIAVIVLLMVCKMFHNTFTSISKEKMQLNDALQKGDEQ